MYINFDYRDRNINTFQTVVTPNKNRMQPNFSELKIKVCLVENFEREKKQNKRLTRVVCQWIRDLCVCMRFCNDISDLNLWGRHQSDNHVLSAENVLNARLLTSFVITFPETLSSTEMIPKTGGRVIILHIAQHEHETFIRVQISLCCSEIQITQMFVLMWARTIWGIGSLLAGYWYQCLSRNDL